MVRIPRLWRAVGPTLWLCLTPGLLEAATIQTPAEASNFTHYSQTGAISRFLSRLDEVSPRLEVRLVGRTLHSNLLAPRDLYLCIITKGGVRLPSQLSRTKPTILLVASQHGDEHSAKEAVLQLIRDLTVGELEPLLEQVNVLVVPQANPYGNALDQRRNEQNVDQNRDHVKLESPGVQAIHRVFRDWMPEVTVDVHEKGDDYYRVSIGCVSNANIHEELQSFSRSVVLTEVAADLKREKVPFHEYLITQPLGVDSSAGAATPQAPAEPREMMKRYSTTDLNDGRNSLGIYETLSFIQEGSSRSDLETLRERTRWQYLGLRSLIESVARHGERVGALVRERRSALLATAAVYSADDLVHLRMEYVRDEQQPTLTIKRFVEADPPIRGVLKVDKRAGDLLTREDVAPPPFPPRQKVERQVVKNWFPEVQATLSVTRPLGYVVPAAHPDVVDTMLQHGLEIDVFLADAVMQVEASRVLEVIPSDRDYLAPTVIDVASEALQIVAKTGDFYVSCEQPGASLIPNLLEPQAQYGLIRYWKYGLVPEEGDVFPFYRVTTRSELPLAAYKRWTR